MRILGIAALGTALAGCAQYEAQQQQEREYQRAAQENADAKCRPYGVAPGSPG